MYGKFFASTFTGSMFGAGPAVFAVWGYVIANTVDSQVELNPQLLAAVLGSTVDEVNTAIDTLCLPDPKSRNPEANGRRLQREGQYQYRVTSHEIYRQIRNEEDRRTYNREKQRESRARRKASLTVIDNSKMSALSVHTEAEAEAEAEADKNDPRANALVESFEGFWAEYPKKAGKKDALKAWMKLKPSAELVGQMLDALEIQMKGRQWRDGFVPLPATWLRGERWTDELDPRRDFYRAKL